MTISKLKSGFIAFGLLACITSLTAQRVDTEALKDFSPATVRQTWEICRHVSLNPAQQTALARAIEKENKQFIKAVQADEGYLNDKATKKLAKMRENALHEILTTQQQLQYWRGVYNAEALAEGNGVADRLQKKYNLTDQNWKFIRNAFYKMALDSRAINKVMADTPKKAREAISMLRMEQLDEIEKRGGLRVNDEGTEVVFTRPFDPLSLRKE